MCNCPPNRFPIHVIQATAAMCSACSRRKGVDCDVTGIPTQWHRVSGDCPRKRFPDKAGIVKWMGVKWMGVPMPIRLWLVLLGKVERPDDFTGCGCLVAAKGLLARLAAIS